MIEINNRTYHKINLNLVKRLVNKFARAYKVEQKEISIAFIGDDVNDLQILQKVGFAACPVDAVDEVKKIVHYKCKNKGGKGAFREVVDLILKYHKLTPNE